MKQIYKITIKTKSDKQINLYFESKNIANSLANHLTNCKDCDKKECLFINSFLLETETIQLFDKSLDLSSVSNFDNMPDFVKEMLDELIDEIFEKETTKDIFNNHYFGKKFEA